MSEFMRRIASVIQSGVTYTGMDHTVDGTHGEAKTFFGNKKGIFCFRLDFVYVVSHFQIGVQGTDASAWKGKSAFFGTFSVNRKQVVAVDILQVDVCEFGNTQAEVEKKGDYAVITLVLMFCGGGILRDGTEKLFSFIAGKENGHLLFCFGGIDIEERIGIEDTQDSIKVSKEPFQGREVSVSGRWGYAFLMEVIQIKVSLVAGNRSAHILSD